MNHKMILDAMTDIDNAHILSAQKKLGYDQTPSPRRLPLRRVLVLAAVIAAFMSICFATAMALSPKLQEMVFRFLTVPQTDVIPENTITTELSAEDMYVQEAVEMGGLIQGRYVYAPVSSHARGGVFLVCTDEVEMKQGSHYDAYYECNGEIIRLEEKLFKREYQILGNTIPVEFEWVEHNGITHFTWVEPEVNFRMWGQSGAADSLMIQLNLQLTDSQGQPYYTWYPVLLNLHTGELTDILAGAGAEHLPYVEKAAISEDKTKLLLGQEVPDNDAEYAYLLHYADLTEKKLYSLDDLSGEHVDACSLTADSLVCWNVRDDVCRVWCIDLGTMERKDILTGTAKADSTTAEGSGILFLEGFDYLSHWGNMYIGSCFALERDDAANMYIIDLTTGNTLLIEGFQWQPSLSMLPSPDGKKLLLANRTPGGSVHYVAVVDFETMTMVEFNRVNASGASEQIYWFDPNTVVVTEGTSSDSLSHNLYLYSLEDTP